MTVFYLAILLILYSYIIFTIGLFEQINPVNIGLITLIFTLISIICLYKRKEIIIKEVTKIILNCKKDKIILASVVLITLLVIINLIGALAPEISFDALWYHLTLPKLYISEERIWFVPGGLFYYSAMPKLIDLLYVTPLMIANEIGAKLIHYFFGIGTLIILFNLSQQFISRKLGFLVVLIFLSNLVVSWEMTVAYIDLGRTFFETLGLLGIVFWLKNKNKKYLILSGLMIGAAVASKYLALLSVMVSSIIVLWNLISFYKLSFKSFRYGLLFILSIVGVPLPWFIFSLIHTGNPLYPSFSTPVNEITLSISQLNPLVMIRGIWNMFMSSSDPISPIYVMLLPLIVFYSKKFKKIEKFLLFYALLSIILLYFLPAIGGGRFILAYLPLYSLLIGITLSYVQDKRLLGRVIILIFLISVITIIYRGISHVRYLPVVLGLESKESFLAKNLDFSFGDYYDIDQYMKKHIKSDDKVLVIGTHNLFYINFPFVHESYVKSGEMFNYILVQNGTLPERFKSFKRIYKNNITQVELYSSGGKWWKY